MSDMFPPSDPLLMEFAQFLRSTTTERDIKNKIGQTSKMLKYLSTLQTATSDKPATAEAKLLENTSAIAAYFEQLSKPPINLKPSAMKTELNAILHFIKFIKRTRNLAVTDPTFNSALENTTDIVTTFQERTMNKINKDRNYLKATVNIQEALPFTINDVRRQTEDATLVSRVSELAEKYSGTGRMCCDLKEYNVVMRYLLSIVVFSHFQRPCVAQNMTIDEFVRAKTASDGRVVIFVSDHKTGAQGPAQVALEQDHHQLFSLYARRSGR